MSVGEQEMPEKEQGFGNQLWVWGGRIENWGCRVGIRGGLKRFRVCDARPSPLNYQIDLPLTIRVWRRLLRESTKGMGRCTTVPYWHPGKHPIQLLSHTPAYKLLNYGTPSPDPPCHMSETSNQCTWAIENNMRPEVLMEMKTSMLDSRTVTPNGIVDTNVSEEHRTSIFSVEKRTLWSGWLMCG